jgi:iron complex transport system ATP-binding protein
MSIKMDNVDFSYSDKIVLHNICMEIEKSHFVAILGPNGVGKSTLLHCMNKILEPTKGTILIEDKNLEKYSIKDLSKIIGYVPCSTESAFPMSVIDTIMVGRNPHNTWKSGKNDLEISYEALKILNIEDLALRPFGELSSGQHQKVMLARGLAQESKILLLDEPTSNLDIKHQLEVTKMLKMLSEKNNMTVVMICHDINIASKYADKIILMHDGSIYAYGTPSEIITSENLFKVYGVKSDVIESEGRPHIILKDGGDF